MGFKRHASAVWTGNTQSGSGTLTTPQSGLFTAQPYSFKTRFADEKGTNPEELLAAAHAGCYAMALSFMLQNAGITAERIEVTAAVAMDMGAAGPTATGVHLTVNARVPGLDAAGFADFAEKAKTGCVISRALALPVSMDASLSS